MTFNDQPSLRGAVVSVAPLTPVDLEPLHAAAADPRIWAGHPAKDRWKSDVFDEYFFFLLDAGGTLKVTHNDIGEIIGCSRYYVPPDQPDDIAIGFTFLARAYWGGATNRDLKRLMLGHAFAMFEKVWFHIDPTNLRSQKATQRLGADFAYETVRKIGPKPSPWLCYCLTKAAWQGVLETA